MIVQKTTPCQTMMTTQQKSNARQVPMILKVTKSWMGVTATVLNQMMDVHKTTRKNQLSLYYPQISLRSTQKRRWGSWQEKSRGKERKEVEERR